MEENKKQEQVEKKIEREVEEAEKELAKEVTKIEKKVEEKKITKTEAKEDVKEEVSETVKEVSEEVKKIEDKAPEKKPVEKKKDKKKPEEKKVKKTEAVVNGKDLPLSIKQCIAICNFIRGKTIDKAILQLGEVLEMKRAIPMKGELPHRKGKGMERGRYPIKATQQFIKLLKQLAANASVNEIEIEKGIECKANRAARPYKRFGNKRFKRSHVILKLKAKK